TDTLRDGPDGMLPSARTLYEIEATKLTSSYHAGVSTSTLLAVLLAGGVLLAVLAATQVYLARATRRLVNVRLALATTLIVRLAVQSRLGRPSTKDAATRLNSALDQGITIAQDDFGRRAGDALSALDGLPAAIPLLTALAALLALSGVRERLEEYR